MKPKVNELYNTLNENNTCKKSVKTSDQLYSAIDQSEIERTET